MKKFVIATAATITTFSAISYADPVQTADFDQKYTSSVNWVTNQTYPAATNQTNPLTPSIVNTPYLNNLQLTNGAGLKPTDMPHHFVQQQAQLATEANISNSLKQFLFNASANNADGQKKIKATKITLSDSAQNGNDTQPKAIEEEFQKYVNDNSLSTLINGKNDINNSSIYITNPDFMTAIQGNLSFMNNVALFSKPATTHDDYLNFSTLISPTAYTPQQAHAAKKYIVFAAQSTKDLAADLKLKDLLPTKLSDAQKKNLPNVIYKFKNDERFLKYMMQINNMVAIRSIAINSLEYLIAERTPVSGLGKAAGKTTKTASPLEVEAYQANHRITDPNWYASVMQDSPATVQRSILIMLAEIEHQNYQAHLDRERILAALTAANLSNNANSSMALKETAMAANDAISDAVKQYNPSQAAPAVSNTNNNNATQSTSPVTTNNNAANQATKTPGF